MGTRSFPAVKRPGRGADHPPPSSTEVTKGYGYTSIHPLGQFRPVTELFTFYLIDKTLTYTSETWIVTKRERKQMNIFQRTVYIRILGPVYGNAKEN
jgi:hypothetical protein